MIDGYLYQRSFINEFSYYCTNGRVGRNLENLPKFSQKNKLVTMIQKEELSKFREKLFTTFP